MPIDMVKPGSKVNITKGQQVVMQKPTSGGPVMASALWSAEKDYDVLGLVVMKDGSLHWASQFGTYQTPKFTPKVKDSNGRVVVTHMGDVDASGGQSGGSLLGGLFGRRDKSSNGLAKEDLKIELSDKVDCVYVVVYSARKNGAGSFRRYGVSMEITGPDGTQVRLDANAANANDGVYTCVPGVVRNTPQGLVIEALEQYSNGGENRPTVINGQLVMDRGEENKYKK